MSSLTALVAGRACSYTRPVDRQTSTQRAHNPFGHKTPAGRVPKPLFLVAVQMAPRRCVPCQLLPPQLSLEEHLAHVQPPADLSTVRALCIAKATMEARNLARRT